MDGREIVSPAGAGAELVLGAAAKLERKTVRQMKGCR
jgi:hypothetical protein